MPIIGENGQKVTLLKFKTWGFCPEEGRVAEFTASASSQGYLNKRYTTKGTVFMSRKAFNAICADNMGKLSDTEHAVLQHAALS